MRLFRGCPLLLLLAVTGILFSGISVRGERGVYRNIPVSSGYEPVCAPMMKGIHDGIYPWSIWDAGLIKGKYADHLDRVAAAAASLDVEFPDVNISDEKTVSGGELPGPESVSGNQTESSGSLSGNEVKGNGDRKDGSVSSGNIPESEIGGESGQTQETFHPQDDPQNSGSPQDGTPAFQHVAEDYFDDALFIGDSRTVGLFEYGHIEDRAQFYAQTSLMIYEVMEKPKAIVKTDDERAFITVEEALSERQFGKIYIMLGLNEMGFGTPESFGKAFGTVISRIRELQPDAIIYIQSIMHVASEKNQTDPVYNNTNIELRNQPLVQLADNRNVFYLDINEALCDETGCLVSDWTFDQVHLKAAYYQVWKDFLLDHAIVR